MLRRAVIAVVVVALLAGAGLCVRSRSVYGTFAFWGVPARIDYCERRYYPSSHDVRGPLPELRTLGRDQAWKVVGRAYAGRPIYAIVDLDPDRSSARWASTSAPALVATAPSG